MKLLTHLARRARRLAARVTRPAVKAPHSRIWRVAQPNDLGPMAAALSEIGRTGYQATLRRLRDLYELATPALYLQVTTSGEPCRIVLVPWDRGQVAFSGRGFHVLAGAEATTGVQAFLLPPGSRTQSLYSGAPDHPLFAVSIGQPGVHEFRGHFPPYLTHVTIIADGREVVMNCPLAHDQGARVFRVQGRAA